LAMLASAMKIRLPGFKTTISINFVFILIGIALFSFGETVLVGLGGRSSSPSGRRSSGRRWCRCFSMGPVLRFVRRRPFGPRTVFWQCWVCSQWQR
jgi:hypothetical protein